MRGKISRPEDAFTGRFDDHHAFLLAKMLARVDGIDADISDLDAKDRRTLRPFADAVIRLTEIPGVGVTAARVLIAEIGVDMSRFPTAAPGFVSPLRAEPAA
jgi:transposase